MCVQYWPAGKNREEVYSGVGVTVENEEQLANFMIRTIRLRKVFFSQFLFNSLFLLCLWGVLVVGLILFVILQYVLEANFMIRTIVLRMVFFSQVFFFFVFLQFYSTSLWVSAITTRAIRLSKQFLHFICLKAEWFFVSDSYLFVSLSRKVFLT